VTSATFLAQVGPSGVGEGTIDNIIIDRSVHLYAGAAVLVALVAAVVLVGLHAWRNEPLGRAAGWSVALAQVVLAVQVLIGIKLLDQGQGIVQLYIHYVGGLIPLGAFLVGGWFARGDSGRSTRILAALLAVGLLSAAMAFFIGRAYANGTL
jgi:heme A synthase